MQKIPCSRFNFETLNRNNGWKRNPRLPNLCTSLTTDQTQSRTWFFYISSHLLFFWKKKKPNQKIDYRHKFESSTFAFVRFEISTLLKLEISTLQKLEISSFRRVENFKLQKGWNQTQKQMIQAIFPKNFCYIHLGSICWTTYHLTEKTIYFLDLFKVRNNTICPETL